MSDLIEKRGAKRVNISCELRFRTLDSDVFYEACCIDLSSSGVLFCSEHEFKEGDKLEVKVIPDPPIRFSTTFIVNVVRIDHQGNGLFKVGATIEYNELA